MRVTAFHTHLEAPAGGEGILMGGAGATGS